MSSAWIFYSNGGFQKKPGPVRPQGLCGEPEQVPESLVAQLQEWELGAG
jgi:hypothetical protein